jgi:Protein of unknown function (DUF3106)
MRSVNPRFLSRAAGVMFCLLTMAAPATAQNTSVPAPGQTNSVKAAPVQTRTSPVETFRKLLAMTPEQRTEALKIYPSGIRERIVAKLQEYEILPEPFRELRLRVTELRWYLLPLLKMPPAERVEQLKSVPEPYQKLIAARLEEWDIWPPSLKTDVLEYETTMRNLVGKNGEIQPQMGSENLSEAERSELNQKLERWKALPLTQRRQMYGAFQRYFELSDGEKQKTMEALSEPERKETEKLLDPIEKWPKPQQEIYMAAFQQFANMSLEERRRFMQNAGRWQKMTEVERQAWRDLVRQLSEMPPLPLGFVPPARQPAGVGLPVAINTNPTAAPVK